ncbi:thioviridamide family RiPP peptide [Nonomuraea sp. NPDC050153]|uniref:thioviridamide family RiPP peptide n=1 Tax=Nonomuraea sp. NPDC050153 TaxID=3364359 RepID=UPI0037909BF1
MGPANTVAQIRAEESAETAFSELAGATPEDLQQFLEEKVGLSPDEGIQGSFTGIIVTAGVPCSKYVPPQGSGRCIRPSP